MIEQYLTDVAAASTGTSGQTCTAARCNVFTVEPQFGWGTTPGGITHGAYTVQHVPGDSMIDTQPYPAKSVQCASPQNTAICVTDAQVQAEVNRVINATHGSRGLHDIWYVFTPPGVDECINPGVCESNAFGGYHSVSNLGHGPTIYAYTGDPIVETSSGQQPGQRSRGLSRCRARDRHRRARGERGDDRPRGSRLHGPERVRDRGQVRVRTPVRHPARVRPRRISLQPGGQRPQVPDPGDVGQPGQQQQPELRSGDHQHHQPAAAAAGPPDPVLADRQRQHRAPHGRGLGHGHAPARERLRHTGHGRERI